MKSETLVKIRENRIKYFLEIKHKETEKKTGLKSENNDLHNDIDKDKYDSMREDAFVLLQRHLFNNRNANQKLKEIKGAGQQILKRISMLNNFISNTILKSTEKMRNRIFSFLVILFDA